MSSSSSSSIVVDLGGFDVRLMIAVHGFALLLCCSLTHGFSSTFEWGYVHDPDEVDVMLSSQPRLIATAY